jgi:hypothetical protein
MPENDENLERELARLSAATEGLRPRAGFVDRVGRAIVPARAPGFGEGVARFGTAVLAIAALSAAFAVAMGFRGEQHTSEAFASAYWVEDLDW